jgi:thiamine kinase-like enzyme
MAELKIPSGPQELTPEWLTGALRETETIKSATVTSFDTTPTGEGTGLLGQLAVVMLHYDQPEEGAPASLVAKFPAAEPENRETGKLFRFYERENRFYEQLADKIELRTPRCYYSAMNAEAAEHVLLLEDLSSARVGDQVAGCSLEEAELAIGELAKFHASWWESPRLSELDWMPFTSDPVVTQPTDQSYAQAWAPFVQNFGGRLSPSILEIGERLGKNVTKILEQIDAPPKTILHGDYRLDNLFFGGSDGADPLTVIDWQISMRGRGTYDVGYFMSQSMDPADRKASEMEILRMYHETLVANGVRDYDFDQCLHDYRFATLFCLVYPVISGGSLDLTNERGVTLVTAMMDRSVAAITDLNAGELMPD